MAELIEVCDGDHNAPLSRQPGFAKKYRPALGRGAFVGKKDMGHFHLLYHADAAQLERLARLVPGVPYVLSAYHPEGFPFHYLQIDDGDYAIVRDMVVDDEHLRRR